MEVCGAGAHHDQETPDHMDTCTVDMVILIQDTVSGGVMNSCTIARQLSFSGN